MILNATVHELSSVLPFCQFFHFLIYNSVRFVYISFTFSFFLSCRLNFPPRHFYPAIRVMRGISLILNSFFLPKRLPKLAPLVAKTASPWFLKEFLFVNCGMSLFYSAQAQIIITSHCRTSTWRNTTIYSNATMLLYI